MLKLPATSHHLCPNWRWCYCKRLLSRWLRAGLFLHQPIGFLVVRLSPCRKCPNTQKMAVDCPLVITSIAETLFQSSVRNLIKTWIVRDKHCQWSIRVCTVHLHKSKIINSHSSSHYYWILWSKHYIKVPLVSRRACNYVRSNELWKWRHRSHHFPIIGFIFRQCFRFYVAIAQWYDAWCLIWWTAQLVEQASIGKSSPEICPALVHKLCLVNKNLFKSCSKKVVEFFIARHFLPSNEKETHDTSVNWLLLYVWHQNTVR